MFLGLNVVEINVSDTEKIEYKTNDRGFEILSYSIWSQSFDAWVKQDFSFLFKTYPLEYEKIIRLVDKNIKESL